MPNAFYLKQPAFPKVAYIQSDGSEQVYDLGSYPTGHDAWSKPDTQHRKRPLRVTDFSSLTPYGGHYEETLFKAPLNHVADLGYLKMRLIDYDSTAYATVGSPGPPPAPDWQTALRLAIKDQKVNLANALAEAGQTNRMFFDNAKAIADSFRALRRGDTRKAFKALGAQPRQLRGTVANRWLELRYGWLPLLSDLHGSVQELQTAFNRPFYRKVQVRKVAENRLVREGTRLPGNPGVATSSDDSYKTVTKVVAYVRGNPPVETRLGFTNPLGVAWELLPYSFVVDWFIPIGNWLNAMDADVGTTHCYGTVTTKTKIISTTSLGSHYHRREYVRSVFDGVPALPLPSYKPSLGVIQIANGLALLSQAFKPGNSSGGLKQRRRGKWEGRMPDGI